MWPNGGPDGIISNRKYQFGLYLEGLAMENVGIFNGPFVFFTAFGYFCGHLVKSMVIWHIPIIPILVLCTNKNLAILAETANRN
jgi:hypothetical protein